MAITESSTITTIVDKSDVTEITNYNDVTILSDNTTENIISNESISYIISEYKQGPAGPPAGINTAVQHLPFIGSGLGPTKTTTGINGNVLYESFSINDELFVFWILPDDLNRNVNPKFEGTLFPTTDNAGGFFSSWEIHITVHNKDHTYEYDGIITANDLATPTTAFEDTHAYVELDRALYLTNDTYAMHIKLKRVTSSNDDNIKIGVSDLHMSYGKRNY